MSCVSCDRKNRGSIVSFLSPLSWLIFLLSIIRGFTPAATCFRRIRGLDPNYIRVYRKQIIFLGGGIALAINKLAHHIFAVEKNSHASTAIRAVAFLAGAGACYIVAPHAAIYAFTVKEAQTSLLVAVAIVVVFGKKSKSSHLFAGQLNILSWVGLFGRITLISVGTAAAGIGAIV